jgi:hypothetical protein
MVVVFNATLSNISVISCRGVQYYWWRKPEHPDTNLKMICSSEPAVIEKKQHAWTDGRTWYNLMPCTPSSNTNPTKTRSDIRCSGKVSTSFLLVAPVWKILCI